MSEESRGKKPERKKRVAVPEAEVIPPEKGALVERDEMGQRTNVYRKYKQGVDYGKIGTSDMEEVVGTIYCVRNARGQVIGQPTFRSGAELQGAIDAYWDFLLRAVKSGHEVYPDAEGLASFIGISRTTLMRWRDGGTNPEFAPVIEQTMNDIAAATKQLAKKNKIPTLVAAIDLNNNHGYVSNNSKVDIDITARREPAKPEALIDQARLLP